MRVALIVLTSRGSNIPDSLQAELKLLGFGVVFPADSSRRYAAAVASGLSQAAAANFTHAITMDLDRRHQPADLPAFVSAIKRSPSEIINGYRARPPRRLPLSVRIARGNGDLWIGCAAWHWMTDAAWGFRAYPLGAFTSSAGTRGARGDESSFLQDSDLSADGKEPSTNPVAASRVRDHAIGIADLSLKSRGQEVDVELFAKSAWAGLKTVSLPVTIAADSSPQVMSLAEFWRFGVTITSLVMQRLLFPPAILVSINRREVARLPRPRRVAPVIREVAMLHARRPIAFATAVGVGVFFGIAPVWGFQILLAAGVAHVLGLSKRLVIACTTISSPLTIPLILYASLLIGHAIMRGQAVALPRPSAMTFAAVWPFLSEYVLGAVFLAVTGGAVSSLSAYAAAKWINSTAAKVQ